MSTYEWYFVIAILAHHKALQRPPSNMDMQPTPLRGPEPGAFFTVSVCRIISDMRAQKARGIHTRRRPGSHPISSATLIASASSATVSVTPK